MNRSRFAYFLNAIHYCIWLNDIKFGDFLRKFSSAFMSLVLTICFTKKFKRRQEERMAKVQKIMNKLYYDKEVGYHICWAHHWFGYFYSCYSAVLSFIIFGIILHFWAVSTCKCTARKVKEYFRKNTQKGYENLVFLLGDGLFCQQLW